MVWLCQSPGAVLCVCFYLVSCTSSHKPLGKWRHSLRVSCRGGGCWVCVVRARHVPLVGFGSGYSQLCEAPSPPPATEYVVRYFYHLMLGISVIVTGRIFSYTWGLFQNLLGRVVYLLMELSGFGTWQFSSYWNAEVISPVGTQIAFCDICLLSNSWKENLSVFPALTWMPPPRPSSAPWECIFSWQDFPHLSQGFLFCVGDS